MSASHAALFEETLDCIRANVDWAPEVGIVLGTGLAGLAGRIDVVGELPYDKLPHFPLSTVESHSGRLIFGTLGGKKVVAMQGRMHYYEGYSCQEITYPIRVLKLLGIRTLLLSNAAGGLNLGIKKGDLVALDDHINLLPDNPLRGPNLDAMGPRFPDMSAPYDPQLLAAAEAIAQEMPDTTLHRGVYVSVPGPNLETRAEYRWLRSMGADVVGMSTVPEVIVARHMGLRVAAISVVTDECDPENLAPVTLEEVIAVATEAEPKLTRLMERLVADYA